MLHLQTKRSWFKPHCPQTCKNMCKPLKNPGKKLKRLMINSIQLNLKNCNHILSPRKLHPVLRAERAEKDRFTTGQKNYFFGCLMNVILDVVK